MSVLIVGGDRLGKIPERLSQCGFNCIKHISGRKCQNCRVAQEMDMVLVLTDYIGHNLCEKVKAKAKAREIPVLFSRRSWARIYKKLDFCGFLN
ncbi:DUF2325 domain-containing protein [Halanaerobaculum tunisiense]